MKSTLKYFAAAFAIVAAAACSKEHNDDLGIELETKYLTISASYESQTKTLLGVDNWANWTDEDAICLFYEGKDEFLYLNDDVLTIDPTSNDNDPTKAIFSGNATVAKNYYAAYPSSGWQAKSDMYLEFQGLNSQVATKNSFDPKKHIALSVDSKDNHFFFQNACALLKVTVGFDNVHSIKVDGSISDDIGFGIPFTFRPGELDINGFSYYYNNYNPTITLSNADPTIPLENGATYYIVVPHTTVSDFKVSLSDEKGNIIYSKKKASNFTIERNKIYDLGILKKEPPKVGDYFYSDGTFSTELDKSKTPVGVIFYTGDPTEKDEALKRDYPNCTNGLAIALKPHNTVWHNSKLTSSNYSSPLKFNYVPSASNWTWGGYTIKSMWKEKSTNLTLYSNCGAGPEGASEWYMPTPIEWGYFADNISSVNEKIKSANGTQIETTTNQQYWMPFLYASSARTFYFSGNSLNYYTISNYNTTYKNAYPIFAF